jgi:hypothetical protein
VSICVTFLELAVRNNISLTPVETPPSAIILGGPDPIVESSLQDLSARYALPAIRRFFKSPAHPTRLTLTKLFLPFLFPNSNQCKLANGKPCAQLIRIHSLELEEPKMKHFSIKLALLSTLMFVAVNAFAQQPQSQNPPAPDQSAQQPTEAPPHVDAEPNPDDRALEKSIQSDFGKDEHMAYSNVSVHVTDTEIMLTGTVQTSAAKDQAEKIASEHAGSRKITNQIKINTNTHPGAGI